MEKLLGFPDAQNFTGDWSGNAWACAVVVYIIFEIQL